MKIPLEDRLRAALLPAMKARTGAAVTALRSALAAIENAAAVAPQTSQSGLPALGLGVTEVDRRDVDEAEIERIVRAEVDERLTAADSYDRLGHGAQAEELRRQASALEAHLDSGP